MYLLAKLFGSLLYFGTEDYGVFKESSSYFRSSVS